MRRYLVRRAIAFAITLLFVSFVTFVVIYVIPGDPAEIIPGTEGNPEALAALRAKLGLDRPLLRQYIDWLGSALTGNLGVSIQYEVPVGQLIASRLPVTFPLAGLAMCLTILAGMSLGVLAASHHRRPGDVGVMIFSQLGIAIPSFWAGLLLILLFSVYLGWTRCMVFQRSCWPCSSRQSSVRAFSPAWWPSASSISASSLASPAPTSWCCGSGIS